MKTGIKYLVFVCASIMSFACTKFDGDVSIETPKGAEITITATREGSGSDTRTMRDSDGSVKWSPQDAISVFYLNGTNGGSRFISQGTEPAAVAEFRGVLDGVSAGGEDFTNGKYLYGIYPYSPSTSFKDGVATISLSSNQGAVAGTFANGLFPTIARAQGVNLAFYNICGGVKFTVSRDDIASIRFKGNNNERLAGVANVTFDETEIPVVLDEEVKESEEAMGKQEITVYAPAGGTFEVGKEYYIVAYPVALNSGYTMTFRTSDGKEGQYVSNDAVEIQRSVFGVVKQADANITSWADVTEIGGGEESGIYLGILGFNQQLYHYPLRKISAENNTVFDSFIDSLPQTVLNTLLYYAVDETINTMQTTPLPANLSTAAIVTFTDGEDQGSIGMKKDIYDTRAQYRDALNKRIQNEKIGGQPITAYSIGIKGEDVTDLTAFQENLKKLASSPENVYEAQNMAEVSADFKEIAEHLSQSNNIHTVKVLVPITENNLLIRITFDNVDKEHVSDSDLYIEGTLNIHTPSLENVKYEGLSSTSGVEIQGVIDELGLNIMFTFEDVRTNDNKRINTEFIGLWQKVNTIWGPTSEFDKDQHAEVEIKHSSVAIMLLLDCSNSLGKKDLAKIKTNAKDFVNILHETISKDEDSEGNEDNEDTSDNLLYSTTPKDLSLAIMMDSTRYYLTKEDYSKANLSNAVVEGLTIVAGGESFILSLNDIQTNTIASVETANALYGDILPTANQGKIISAKRSDINSALISFGGTKLSTDYGYGYYTASTTENEGVYTDCIYLYSSSNTGSLGEVNYWAYIRGVKPTSYNSAIQWKDPNDLKLAVIIDGKREFLNKAEYNERQIEISTIEGIAVIAGGEKFIVHLHNAQSDYITSVETATELYGDIMPTANQGKIISAKRSDINSALISFGGTKLSTDYGYGYYTASTTENEGVYTDCIYLYPSSNIGSLGEVNYRAYIRGVTTIE